MKRETVLALLARLVCGFVLPEAELASHRTLRRHLPHVDHVDVHQLQQQSQHLELLLRALAGGHHPRLVDVHVDKEPIQFISIRYNKQRAITQIFV